MASVTGFLKEAQHHAGPHSASHSNGHAGATGHDTVHGVHDEVRDDGQYRHLRFHVHRRVLHIYIHLWRFYNVYK